MAWLIDEGVQARRPWIAPQLTEKPAFRGRGFRHRVRVSVGGQSLGEQ